MLLNKNTKSVVKKYHYNKGLYMALGDTNTYYDAAWTDEYSKFTTEAPLLPDNNPITTPEEEINKSEDDDNKNIDNKPSEENKEIVNKQNIPSQNRENPLLWLLDKIIKFIVKLFRRKK